MSDPREDSSDRWRELADLLGLPPEENKPATTPKAAPPPEPAFEEHREAKRAGVEPELPEAEPVTGSLETVAYEEMEMPIFHEERAQVPAESPRPDPEPGPEEDSAQDRPRRGRRRGRRGHKGDVPDRDERPPQERGPRNPAPVVEAARQRGEEGEAEDNPALERGKAPEEQRADWRGGGQDRGQRGKPAEARRRDPEEEEVLEAADSERPEPVPGEHDDEEIDNLKDFNVLSWTELIGSLYRPDR